MHIRQLQLVNAILNEIDRQNPKSTVSQAQLNIIIAAADTIAAAYNQPPADPQSPIVNRQSKI